LAIRVYAFDYAEMQELKKMLEYDPYIDSSLSDEDLQRIRKDPDANTIFARQDYVIKDGGYLGLAREDGYLYIKADEEFLAMGEKKLKKSIKSIRRADPDVEKRMAESIDKERAEAEKGLGFIFG
jgi:hypothetical protein